MQIETYIDNLKDYLYAELVKKYEKAEAELGQAQSNWRLLRIDKVITGMVFLS